MFCTWFIFLRHFEGGTCRNERALFANAARAWEQIITEYVWKYLICMKGHDQIMLLSNSRENIVNLTDFWIFCHGAVLCATLVPSSDCQWDLNEEGYNGWFVCRSVSSKMWMCVCEGTDGLGPDEITLKRVVGIWDVFEYLGTFRWGCLYFKLVAFLKPARP